MKKIIIFLLSLFLLIGLSTAVNSSFIETLKENNGDLDPLVDLEVTVEIESIRFLEDDLCTANSKNLFRSFLPRLKTDDELPSFFVKVFINDEEFTSEVWDDSKYLYDLGFTATLNVLDDQEFVDIRIQLFDAVDENSYDISGDPNTSDVELIYSLKTGHWTGDDQLKDSSGYGRLCGCEDGTIYETDRGCELWFDIYQNDFDGDDIPYWNEVNVFSTDPTVDDTLKDPDKDEIPTVWEWRWGYDPLIWDDHEALDPDGDSINNYEEYLTSQWQSDPFRKDVYVELDMMEDGPNGEQVMFPEIAGEYIKTAFNRQNICFHLDYGNMGGHELVPFDDKSTRRELVRLYQDYFLHGDEDNWRRGVFRYGIITYYVDAPPGYMFRSNAFQLASKNIEDKSKLPTLTREIVYASGYMHELGHTFAFNPIPGHNQWSSVPWKLGWWINRPYKSCMNYGWVYTLVDYSDGSRKDPDIDDWERIDYDAFEREWGQD